MNTTGHRSEETPPTDPGPVDSSPRSPETEAWSTAFFIENHLDYFTHPEYAATPEQIRFMVYSEDEERYYPCSDKMFEAIINRNKTMFIQKKYREVLNRMQSLVNKKIENRLERSYLSALL